MKTSPNPMFRDLCLLEFAEEHLSRDEFIFFFYTWEGRAVSLGRSQSKSRDIIQECISSNIPISIRPSGGKAVIHGSDICFNFIAKQNNLDFGGTLNESYSKVLNYILNRLNKYFREKLGWDCSISSNENKDHLQRGSLNGINCFSNSATGEGIICYEGKAHKVLGSAQMMYASCFLQQGSVLINNGNGQKINKEQALSFELEMPSLVAAFNRNENLNLELLCTELNQLQISTAETEIIPSISRT